MKITNYVGIDDPVITIEKAEDLYPLLDFIQSCMIEIFEKTGDNKADKCATFIDTLMDLAEKEGYGNSEDIDNIEYN